MTPAIADDVAARLHGTPLLLMLDVDGTLCDIVQRADDARVPEETRELLRRLARRPDVCMAIVTGRAAADAHRMDGINGIRISGNHGIERWDANGAERIAPGWERVARSMRAAVAELARVPLDFPGTSVEDKQFTITVHFRQADPATVPALRDEVGEIAERHALRRAEGKAVINLFPPLDIDKGDAVRALVRECGADAPGAAVLFAGDDVTDEDAFTALATHVPGAVTIRVGDDATRTAATFRVATPRDLATILERLERERP
ncbi:MAG TPA: trehalose-phosphatase [Candidatus Elarobacter sp.]|nr:trehalose-phosphatase [Candidatus Elarobacter sp.]